MVSFGRLSSFWPIENLAEKKKDGRDWIGRIEIEPIYVFPCFVVGFDSDKEKEEWN